MPRGAANDDRVIATADILPEGLIFVELCTELIK